MRRRCTKCGKGELRSITHPAKREIDGRVFAADVPATRCNACGEVLISGPGMLAFDRALTGELARSGTVGPQGFRWLRKAARLPSVRLAELLDVTPGTVSRWENGKQTLDRRAIALVSALALEAQGGRAAALELLEALAAGKKPSKRVRLDVRAAADLFVIETRRGRRRWAMVFSSSRGSKGLPT